MIGWTWSDRLDLQDHVSARYGPSWTPSDGLHFLEVLATARADRETGEHGDEAVENAEHSWSASAAFPLINAQDRIFGPTGLHQPRAKYAP